METFASAYKEFVTPQREVVLRAIDAALQRNKVLSFFELNGNSNALFKQRVNDTEVEGLVKTLLAAEGVHIEQLSLAFNHIGDRGAEALAQLFSRPDCPIRSLNLAHNSIGLAGIRALCAALRGNTSVVELVLSGNDVGNEGGMVIAEMLAANGALISVDLDDMNFGTETIIAIATVMNTNRSIRRLSLKNPRLFSRAEETTTHLAKMLQVNEVLEQLSLRSHQIGDAGATVLASHLQENRTLQMLDLSGNRIGSAGGEALAAMFVYGASGVLTLNLSANDIKDDGAAAFAEALTTSRVLSELDLTNNSIGEMGLVSLAMGLAQNESLQRLALQGNHFGPESSAQFLSLLGDGGALEHRGISADFRPYVVDGVAMVANVD